MKKITSFFVLYNIVFTLSALTAQTVSTNAELQTAVAAATAGTTIVLKNGNWTNTYININKTATADNPITIKAETAGNVFFQGNSRIAMGGEFIIIEGIIFKNSSNLVDNGSTLEPIIKFRDSGSNVCNHCTVTNIKIEAYNGTTAQEKDIFKWILIYGQYNEISYSSFIGKKGLGSVINDNRENSDLNYTKIHHNYFADRTFVGDYIDEYNDQDAIRIGNSSTSLSDSYTEIYDNFFNNWFGEIEIISNKSGHNKFYNNTFRNYSGSLTLRHGNNSEVFGNYFFANNNKFSGGIRLTGENHKIYNNYIEEVSSVKESATGTSTSSNLGGINILKGASTSVNGADLSGYYQAKNTVITNNTFVNCDYGIRIGGGSKTLAPQELVVVNNVFLMNSSSKKAIEQLITSENNYPYTFDGNIRQSGTWTLTGNQNGNQVVTTGLLTADTDFYRVKTGSAAIDAGIGTYAFLTKDILEANRPATGFDAGAEEFGGNGTRLPYKVSDVGIKLGFLGTNTLSTSNFILKTGIMVYPIPVQQGKVLNIESAEMIGELSFYDFSGKKVFSKNIVENSTKIFTDSLNKGIYILKIKDAYTRFIIE